MNGCTETDKKNVTTVSVIVLTYGDYSHLKQTIHSILQQDYPITQLILSDDGSGVPFPSEVIFTLKQRFAQEKLLIRSNSKNLGTVAHMNLTAGLCEGTWIKFLAAGDAFSSSDALARLICFAQEQNTLVVTSQAVVCNADLTKRYYRFPGVRYKAFFSNTDLFQTLCQANIISATGTVFHRRFFNELGGFDQSYGLLEDWPAWLRLTREGYSIAVLNRVTCFYIVGGVSSESGDAFHSKKLKTDLLLCYEKEIIPYISNFPYAIRKRIYYRYETLKESHALYLLRKYFWLELKDTLKRTIKWWLFRV